MNFRQLSDNDLADFAGNVKELLSGTKLTAIDLARRNSLEAAIDSKPNELDFQAMTAMIAEGERKAAVSVKNYLRDDLISLMSQVRNTLVAGRAPKSQFDLCGFNYPEKPVGSYVAKDPTELSVSGYSNGVIRLKFSGNNSVNSVFFEIWRRQGDTEEWILHSSTKKQSFTDTAILPGHGYEYKVRAVAARSVSNFSNVAIGYGVG